MEALGTHRKYPKIVEHKIVAPSMKSTQPSILPVILVLWLCSKTLRPPRQKLVGPNGLKFCVGTLGTHMRYHHSGNTNWSNSGIFLPVYLHTFIVTLKKHLGTSFFKKDHCNYPYSRILPRVKLHPSGCLAFCFFPTHSHFFDTFELCTCLLTVH